MTPCHHYQMRHGVIEMSCYFFIVDFSFKIYVEIDRNQFYQG